MYMVLIYFLSWTLYYFLIERVNSKRSSEWNSRIVSLTHAAIATKTVETCFFIGPWPFDTFGEPNTYLQTLTISISAGYFIFETLWCIIKRTEDSTMMLHHFISLASLLYCLLLGKCGSEVIAIVWGSEITNPFLQIRWFLRETKQNNTRFAYLNDWIFFILFGIVRIGIGGVLGYCMYFSKNSPLPLKLGGYVFYFIGVVWMWKIFKFAQKRLFYGLRQKPLPIETNGKIKT